jgi:adenine deaminase
VSPEFSALPLADHRPFREADQGIDATDPCSGDRGVADEQRRGLCWLAGVDFGAVTCPWAALVPLVNANNAMNCSFAADDKLADDLVSEGHIDHCVRKATRMGLPPMTALQIATISTARHYRLRNFGAIAPR